jgi:hypothetical protein
MPISTDPADGFDVAYIYGPVRGREVYAGVKLEFEAMRRVATSSR